MTEQWLKSLELKFKAHRGWIEKVVENILAIDSDSDDSGSDEE